MSPPSAASNGLGKQSTRVFNSHIDPADPTKQPSLAHLQVNVLEQRKLFDVPGIAAEWSVLGAAFCGLLFISFASPTSAVLVNVSIDDTFGDPNGINFTYNPPNVWNYGPACTACTAHPDASQVFDRTWHDATFKPDPAGKTLNQIVGVSVDFNGSAIYVFCVLTGTDSSPDGNTDMLFKIDNEQVGTFVQAPKGNPQYNYSVPVYVNTSLTPSFHTFTLESGHLGRKALVLLDRLVYTKDVPDNVTSAVPTVTAASTNVPPPPSSSPNFSSEPSPLSSPNSSSEPSPLSNPITSSEHHSALSSGALAGIAASMGFLVSLVLAFLVYRRIITRQTNIVIRPIIINDGPAATAGFIYPTTPSSTGAWRMPLMSEAERPSSYNTVQLSSTGPASTVAGDDRNELEARLEAPPMYSP